MKKNTIKEAILQFSMLHDTGTLADISAYVRGYCQRSYSPESVGRILRMLRADQELYYVTSSKQINFL